LQHDATNVSFFIFWILNITKASNIDGDADDDDNDNDMYMYTYIYIYYNSIFCIFVHLFMYSFRWLMLLEMGVVHGLSPATKDQLWRHPQLGQQADGSPYKVSETLRLWRWLSYSNLTVLSMDVNMTDLPLPEKIWVRFNIYIYIRIIHIYSLGIYI
jgi:hypothetical protein